MKINFLFLLIVLILTVLSKILQFVFHSKIGDFIVIPALIFFVLALLFSNDKFNNLLEKEHGGFDAFIIAFWACLSIVMLQLALMLLIGYQNKWGFGFLVLFLIGFAVFLYQWFGF